MPGRDANGAVVRPDLSTLVELGGGNLVVQAGRDVNGGAYYVERGQGNVEAGRNVTTNATRTFGRIKTVAETWLPTTLFLGKGDFTVAAAGDLRLGPVANVFLLPAGISNTAWNKTYFSTFSPDDSVEVTSLTGAIRLSENAPDGMLYSWLNSVQLYNNNSANASFTRPWLRLTENSVASFKTVTTLAPSTLKVTAFTGTLNVAGNLNLAASPTGTIEFATAGTITGLNPLNNTQNWSYGVVRLLDSALGAIPGPAAPLATTEWAVANVTFNSSPLYLSLDGLLQEGESAGNDSLQTKLARHGSGPLHAGDSSPLRIYSASGDITGLALFSGKVSRVVAGRDLTDVSLVLQNIRATDISLVAAGRDLIAFAPNTAQRQTAAAVGFIRADERTAGKSGLLEIGGPGTLEVLSGRNLDLGIDPASAAPGIVSVGSRRNPNLPFGGADVTLAAGLGVIYSASASAALLAPGLQSSSLDFAGFVAKFLGPAAANRARYLPYLGAALGLPADTSAEVISSNLTAGTLTEGKALALMDTFYQILRISGRDRNDPASPNFGTYTDGLAAISALFPGSPIPSKDDIASGTTVARPAGPATGNVSMATKEIGTFEGGDIAILSPNGRVTVGRPVDAQKPDQGVLTQRGGDISIYATDNVDVGTSRIFTLRGGNERIWSTWGNIAAGSGSKTVHAAPPTRVLIDPQSADVQNDLAGLATGSGIGVLATLAGVTPGDVDLIAPVGTIDAGDAGIRASGNLNVAARVVLNSSNISVGGVSVGTPPPPPPPNLGSLGAAATVSAGASSAAADVARQGSAAGPAAELPSIISVEVLGYGGGDGTEGPDSGGPPAEDDQTKEKRPSF
jgi:hypothetical protein